MTQRTVTDAAGRTWTCTAQEPAAGSNSEHQGRDVVLLCETESVDGTVELTVGWQWEQMAPNGLARLISQASPVPRR
jgi:hypothetical protein